MLAPSRPPGRSASPTFTSQPPSEPLAPRPGSGAPPSAGCIPARCGPYHLVAERARRVCHWIPAMALTKLGVEGLELDRPEGTPPTPWFHALVACDYLTEVFVEERLSNAKAVAARRARPGHRVEIRGEWSVCYCSDGRGKVGTARVFLVDRLRVI